MIELFYLLRKKSKQSTLFPTSCLSSQSYLEEVIDSSYLYFVFWQSKLEKQQHELKFPESIQS